MYDFIFQDKASDNAANGSSNTNTPVPNKIGRQRRKRVSSDTGIDLTFIYCCSLLSNSFSLITHELFVQSFVVICNFGRISLVTFYLHQSYFLFV